MINYKLLSVLTAFILVTGLILFNPGYAITQKGNVAKEQIFTNLTKTVKNQFENYQLVVSKTKDNKTYVNYNFTGNETMPPAPIEICGDGIDNDGDGLIDENCPIIPPPQPADKPTTNVNSSKFLRVVAIGDIDLNSGLDKELALAKKYNAAIFVVAGDYGYTDCQKVLNKLVANGFNNENSVIIQGNHDCSTTTKNFNGWNLLYGNTNFSNVDGKLSIFAIDANQGFDCSSVQFTALKDKLESSDAWYNIPVVHQPFVTVKSKHPANGQFDCYNPLFKANGIKDVIQAHNHNYQRINVQGIDYLVVGTGTHDTGSSMYPISSDNWNGFNCQKCITGQNGITIMDFQIDNASQRSMQGWFINHNEDVKDKFN